MSAIQNTYIAEKRENQTKEETFIAFFDFLKLLKELY